MGGSQEILMQSNCLRNLINKICFIFFVLNILNIYKPCIFANKWTGHITKLISFHPEVQRNPI